MVLLPELRYQKPPRNEGGSQKRDLSRLRPINSPLHALLTAPLNRGGLREERFMSNYWRTCDEDGYTSTHLLGESGDSSICGHDLAGDDTVHSKDPLDLGCRARITCQHCLAIISIVKEHLKRYD